MNPVRLTAIGLGRFAEIDLTFPTGTVAVVGPNGAGKSTLLNAIELALFADGSRDLASCLGPFADRLEIELTFEHAGDTYRVRRGYRATGSGGKATLDFERAVPDYDEIDLRAGIALAKQGIDPGLYHDRWEPLTRETAAATQALICQTLGLSRATFNASAFLGQGNAAAFPDASPAERKAMLGEILDPNGLWPRLADQARADAKIAEAELARIAATIADREQRAENLPALEAKLAELETATLAARSTLAIVETLLEAAQAELAGNAAAAERVATLTLARDHARTKHADAVLELTRAEQATEQLPAARQLLETMRAAAELIPDLETRLDDQRRTLAEAQAVRDHHKIAVLRVTQLEDDARRAHTERDQANSLLDDRQAKLEALRAAPDDAAHCDRCKQPLGAAARQDAIHSLFVECTTLEHDLDHKTGRALQFDDELAVARATAAEIQPPALAEVEDILTPLTRAKQAADGIPRAEQNLRVLTEQADQLDQRHEALSAAAAAVAAAEAELAAATEGMKDTALLTRAVADARAAVTARRSALEAIAADTVRTRQTVEQLHAAVVELVALRSAQAETNAILDLLRLAEKAYGRDGIPTLITENAIPVLETEANQILERMPLSDGTVMRVELHTQRALKSGDHLRETLDILVSHREVTRRFDLSFPPTHSGGEAFRVSYALRWSLAKLMRSRVSAEVGIMLIDEPDGLDAAGMDSLAAILRDDVGTFPCVMIVSHNPQLATAFEQMIQVEIVEGVSRIVGAREPVAA